MSDDDALAARAAAGDPRAFSALVARHEARVRGFLTRVAGASDADDLAQETFLRAWRRADTFRGGSYPGWLLRIAWRLFLDSRRAARPRALPHPETSVAPEPNVAPDAEARLDAAAVLAALPPEERACLTLCLGQGFSHAEAAAILDMPLGSVKSRVARAAAKARALLEHRP